MAVVECRISLCGTCLVLSRAAEADTVRAMFAISPPRLVFCSIQREPDLISKNDPAYAGCYGFRQSAVLLFLLCFTFVAQSAPVSKDDSSLSVMRGLIETYLTDLAALQRYQNIDISSARSERLRRFYEEQLK